MLGPVLRRGHTSLQPPCPEDMPVYLSWLENPEVTHFLWGRRSIPSLREQEEWLDRAARSDNEVVWKIVVDGSTIGRASIFGIDWLNRGAETSTVIGDPEIWGRGIGSAVVGLRCGFAFGELGLERLETMSLVGNKGMHRALERAGYRIITRLQYYVYRHGQWHDAFLFEILRADWQSRSD